jgi:hypothetical protein
VHASAAEATKIYVAQATVFITLLHYFFQVFGSYIHIEREAQAGQWTGCGMAAQVGYTDLLMMQLI